MDPQQSVRRAPVRRPLTPASGAAVALARRSSLVLFALGLIVLVFWNCRFSVSRRPAAPAPAQDQGERSRTSALYGRAACEPRGAMTSVGNMARLALPGLLLWFRRCHPTLRTERGGSQ